MRTFCANSLSIRQCSDFAFPGSASFFSSVVACVSKLLTISPKSGTTSILKPHSQTTKGNSWSNFFILLTLLAFFPQMEWKINKSVFNFANKITSAFLTSNPQIIQGNMTNWKITRFGHASEGGGNTRINNEIRSSLSRKRITLSLKYLRTLNNFAILFLYSRFFLFPIHFL